MTDSLEEEVEALRERILALETALYEELDVSLGPQYELPQEPQMIPCDECGLSFAVTVDNAMQCPWCGTTQTEGSEADA